jgi:PTH1 family peptidyl-tRNA hydrolase
MMEKDRWLIVGLGNPGQRYRHNRHNVGFQSVERLARAHNLTFDKRQGHGQLALGQVQGRAVILLKPQTYMNESGRSVASVSRFYKVPMQRLLVIFDELDLPLGGLRLRTQGGSGGHKGMKSIIAQLGSQDFPRVRVGIGRPPGRMDPADYVLQDFREEELPVVEQIYDRVIGAVECWLMDGIDIAMTNYNRVLGEEQGEKTEHGRTASPFDA